MSQAKPASYPRPEGAVRLSSNLDGFDATLKMPRPMGLAWLEVWCKIIPNIIKFLDLIMIPLLGLHQIN